MDSNYKKRAVHKGKVNQYYRFFLPVIHNNQGYTLVITCEEHNGELQLSKDEDLHLHEMSTVGIKNKRSTDPERSSTTRMHPSGIPTPKYNIRQMLKNVKGIDGKPYIDKNGIPNWGETVQQLEGPLTNPNCVTGSWKASVILWEKPIHQKSGGITGIMPKTEDGCISNTGIMITMPSKMRDFLVLSASCGILSPAFRLTAGKRR